MTEFELVYNNKKNENEIIQNTLPAILEVDKDFGKTRTLQPDDWKNMLIFGENLQVMKTLLSNPAVKGKVKLIYIDPPFSTNTDFKIGSSRTSTISSSSEDQTAYSDTLLGAEFIEFLRERFILIRELMAEDASIYVHIDYKIGHYVKIIMDEVFGKEHFINDIARIKCNPKNFKRTGYGNIKDLILFYSKGNEPIWNEPSEAYSDEDILRLFPKIDKDGRRYTTVPLHAPGETKNGATGKSWHDMMPPKGRHWRYRPEVLDEYETKGLIEWSSKNNPRIKIFADDSLKKGKRRQDIWEFKDSPYPQYPTEKNLEMLKVIIRASSNEQDIVLDAFAGSGTTLVAAEELGRRWIGIDSSIHAIETGISKLLENENCGLFSFYTTIEKDAKKHSELHSENSKILNQ